MNVGGVAGFSAPNLGHGAHRLFVTLDDFADNDTGVCGPSIGRLASELGVSERSVYRYLDELYDGGYVDKVEGGGGRSRTNAWHLNVGKWVGLAVDVVAEGVRAMRQRIADAVRMRFNQQNKSVTLAEQIEYLLNRDASDWQADAYALCGAVMQTVKNQYRRAQEYEIVNVVKFALAETKRREGLRHPPDYFLKVLSTELRKRRKAAERARQDIQPLPGSAAWAAMPAPF